MNHTTLKRERSEKFQNIGIETQNQRRKISNLHFGAPVRSSVLMKENDHKMINLDKTIPQREKSNPRRWTSQEDEALRNAVNASGERNWKAIADQVPGRNHTQCLQRWTKVLKPGLIKGHWTPEEDNKLKLLVAEGRKNWGQVAAQIPGRTSKQCRERWCNHLDPSIKKGAYSPREDKIIIEMQAKLGNRWSLIAQKLSGRTEDAVKIRWKSLMRNNRARLNDSKTNIADNKSVSKIIRFNNQSSAKFKKTALNRFHSMSKSNNGSQIGTTRLNNVKNRGIIGVTPSGISSLRGTLSGSMEPKNPLKQPPRTKTRLSYKVPRTKKSASMTRYTPLSRTESRNKIAELGVSTPSIPLSLISPPRNAWDNDETRTWISKDGHIVDKYKASIPRATEVQRVLVARPVSSKAEESLQKLGTPAEEWGIPRSRSSSISEEITKVEVDPAKINKEVLEEDAKDSEEKLQHQKLRLLIMEHETGNLPTPLSLNSPGQNKVAEELRRAQERQEKQNVLEKGWRRASLELVKNKSDPILQEKNKKGENDGFFDKLLPLNPADEYMGKILYNDMGIFPFGSSGLR